MPPPRHDRNAGGDPEVLERKRRLRREIWDRMEEPGVGRFPGADGRIPNFVGAEAAAQRLREHPVWSAAGSLKANPDSPQWPVRQRALEDGKRVYMAVPRLAEPDPFFLLDPEDLDGSPRSASSIRGASRAGRTVPLDAMRPVDLVVVGSVAVAADGARLGKGGGFSDLELALARSAGLIGPGTPVVTTVHERQVVDVGRIPMAAHDVPVDLVVTPERVVDCSGGPYARPRGLRWEVLTEEKVAAIPLLRRLRNEE